VIRAPRLVDLCELHSISKELESAQPQEIIRWAVERFKRNISFACSFQNSVLIDMAVRVDPGAEILFLDTGYHFRETLDFVEEMRAHYDLNLVVAQCAPDAQAPPCGSEGCCAVRKLLPLDASLVKRAAWLSGVKRVDSSARANTPIVEWDARRAIAKVNPLATWSEEDVARYARDNDLPVHPLAGFGYPSIGCAPTTTPVNFGEGRRAGRWRKTNQTECGLHI
jgi:phosphoadenosine phosphosulfate reductase